MASEVGNRIIQSENTGKRYAAISTDIAIDSQCLLKANEHKDDCRPLPRDDHETS
ncbi:MAG: hypothetical protein QW186_09745 [Candidatus Bathyarchaeia archaeon]